MEKVRKVYRHLITSTPLLRMHLFGKSAHWWLCFPLQQFKTENKIRAWKYSLCPSQKLKLFSECVKYPRIWPRSKTKAKQGCWERENHVLLETCSYSWLLLAQLMTGGFHLLRNWNFVNSLTRLQGACQALKSSPAVWWIRRSSPQHIPTYQPNPPNPQAFPPTLM